MSLFSFCSLFPNHSLYKHFLPFVLLTSLAVQNRKLKALIWPSIHFVVKFLNMNNLFVCIVTLENNNKQYLVSYFYKYVAFLRVFFFYKKTCTLRHSSYIFWLDKKYCRLNCNSNSWPKALTFMYIGNGIRLVLFVVLWLPPKI